ncbi:beta-galactosidase [Glycomyces sp. TRM65418]|uniref:beta-galactosidase n=1 Tax=Glycomyces sp. TRM65418 TaxID=2867006 RepID=UPI001CE64B8F|nr:beta-galactosidase [Glycomyces sp. TRM65418]MCC3761960.1 beta-galactosidase [Glycomyces sp. TRM65418]QZD56038.1 beta-galactosidase [Glycomyces sp. TRM65418]
MTDLSTATVALRPTGLVLDGREEALLCASLFYFRLPREVWEARLAQVRATGYRAIDVYLPWNFHETSPGVWDFEGRRDVGAFLDLAHEAGLLVIARPGPYICSEWDGGALPAWLALEEGLELRQAEPRFLAQVRGWFDRAIPILAERQWGRGGGVVAVQLENELDFFDTRDRTAYMTALRDMAVGHGIDVPLIACAGQGDLFGATGGVEGVAPAFNFYPDDRSAFIEPEVRRYADLVADRGLPLLITETNRSHATLRRLLCSGATLLAPYLQASGYDFGYTPSVGNWGDPGGFMTHDYDFGGYLSPVGESRAQAAEARVLAAVARTLGPALARATTTEAEGVHRVSVTTSSSPSRLVLDGGGTLTGVPNLTEEPGTGWITTALGELPIELAPRSCALVVQDLPLAGFGLPGVLQFANADLVGADQDGLQFASRVPSTVALAADGEIPVIVDLDAPATGEPKRHTVRAGSTAWEVVVLHPEDVPAPDGTAGVISPEPPEPEPLTAATRLDLETRTGETEAHELPPTSEQVGVYRGRTHYAASVAGLTELLVEGAGDIVDLALDGRAAGTFARFGATVRVPLRGAEAFAATVETWGHANFDDARLPGLAIGSPRGLGRVWSVVASEDVTALWTVDGGDQWAGDPAPLRTLGGWSSTRIGLPATYRRPLPVDGVSHYALHLDGLAAPCGVTVDGASRIVSPEDPWVHLAPGEGRELAVALPHWPGSIGAATLLRLEAVRAWEVEPQPDDAILALSRKDGAGESIALPLELDAGEEVWLDVAVPSGGRSLRFAGEQIRISAFTGGELLGRVWLDDPARPRFTGGDPGRLWVPGSWNTGTVRLLVRGTAGDRTPRLERVTAAPVPE